MRIQLEQYMRLWLGDELVYWDYRHPNLLCRVKSRQSFLRQKRDMWQYFGVVLWPVESQNVYLCLYCHFIQRPEWSETDASVSLEYVTAVSCTTTQLLIL
jgi:hypothetical protein